MWALVDCDNFFCSCERVFRPDLRQTPLVVLSNNDGCVVARSRETKAMGIKMGLPYFQLQRDYAGKGIVAFSSNYTLYGDMSSRVMAVLREEAPEVHQYSIDEAFLQLQGLNVDYKTWGEALAAKVRRWTGIPVSVGIAPTKTLAKAASKFAKKYPGYNKCCLIDTAEKREAALKLLQPEDIWGIGRRVARSLYGRGVYTALDFARRSRGWVRQNYTVTGERTWMELNGYEAVGNDDLGGTKKSIVTSRSFPDMMTSLDQLLPHFANYAARCAAKLRKQHSVARMVTVFIMSNPFREDLPQYSNSASFIFPTATCATSELVQAALSILKAIFREGIAYKRGGVMVSDFSPADAVQADLFDFDPIEALRQYKISTLADDINAFHGADTLMLASQQYPSKSGEQREKRPGFAQAIKRDLKSPDYSTKVSDFIVI